MTLLDMLFQGPVKVADLDHEQYGEAAQMLRKRMIVQEDTVLRLTSKGMEHVADATLQELKRKGLVEQFGDGWVATTSGFMAAKGSDRIM